MLDIHRHENQNQFRISRIMVRFLKIRAHKYKLIINKDPNNNFIINRKLFILRLFFDFAHGFCLYTYLHKLSSKNTLTAFWANKTGCLDFPVTMTSHIPTTSRFWKIFCWFVFNNMVIKHTDGIWIKFMYWFH